MNDKPRKLINKSDAPVLGQQVPDKDPKENEKETIPSDIELLKNGKKKAFWVEYTIQPPSESFGISVVAESYQDAITQIFNKHLGMFVAINRINCEFDASKEK